MKTAIKSKTYKHQSRANFPTRECSKCHRYYHARSKECPDCGAPNETRATQPAPEPEAEQKPKPVRRHNRVPQTQAIEVAIEFVSRAGGLGPAKEALEMIDRIRALRTT